MGIGLSYAAMESGSILVPMCMHGTHNLVLFLMTRRGSADFGWIPLFFGTLVQNLEHDSGFQSSGSILVINLFYILSISITIAVSVYLIFLGARLILNEKTKSFHPNSTGSP